MTFTTSARWLAGVLLALVCANTATTAQAQRSSLYQQDLPTDAGAPLKLANTSFVYQPVEPPRELKIHDIVTVVVEEKSQIASKGDIDRKKNANLDAELKSWISLQGLSVRKAKMTDGTPAINGTLDSEYKAQNDLETNDLMKFKLAAEIVDIRPNGTMVIEAHRTIRNNDEIWEQSLTGVVRKEDILPGQRVLSENIAELQIHKRERGDIRDGYRRGWLLKFYDKVSPF